MIRRLLDAYVDAQSHRAGSRPVRS
jgi:hypothetical protein